MWTFSSNAESSLRDLEFGVPQARKRVDPLSPFFPSDKHPCTHAGMFIPGCHELKVFSGRSHFELADDIARRLGTRVGKLTLSRFADGEVQIQIGESVRGKDVYLVQSLCDPVNENIIELLLMASTMRRASAKRVTVVIPYYSYRTHRRASSIATSVNSEFLHSAAADIAKMLEVMGVDRCIAVDLQGPGRLQEACFFSSKIPVETLETVMAGAEYFATQVHWKHPVVILSPNAECLKKARHFEMGLRSWMPQLDTSLAAYIKTSTRTRDEEDRLVGDVTNADVILVDDVVDDCSSIFAATKVLKEKGARKVYAFASHAVLDANTQRQLQDSELEQFVLMDTIPEDPRCTTPPSHKVKRLSIAPMLAELIQAEHFKDHSYIDKTNDPNDDDPDDNDR